MLGRPGVVNFTDIIKIAITLIETTFNKQLNNKSKELEKMYQNAISICISRCNKNC